MRKIVSILLLVVMSFSMMFAFTGCKNDTLYNNPEDVIVAYRNGDKIVNQKCRVMVKVNKDMPTTRRTVYMNYDKELSDGIESITVELPMDETVEQGEVLDVYITDIKENTPGFYSIYGYTKRGK